MASHVVLVRVYYGGEVLEPNSPVEYDGAPDWKYRPTDPVALAEWRENFAAPDRVTSTLSAQGVRDPGLEFDTTGKNEARG